MPEQLEPLEPVIDAGAASLAEPPHRGVGKERYSTRETIPADWLVPQADQPDFLWLDDTDETVEWNVAVESVDTAGGLGYGRKPAIISVAEGSTWTYDELKLASDRLAGSFVELGLRIGDRVALYHSTSAQATVAALGIWKAGGVLTPIPQQARPDDLEFYLHDVQARFVVVGGGEPFRLALDETLRRGTTAVEHVVSTDSESAPDAFSSHSMTAMIARGDPELRNGVITRADDLACVWHTAGTTGPPKASYTTHRRWILAGRSLGVSWNIRPENVWIHGIPVGNVAGTLGRFIRVLQQHATLVEPASLAPKDVAEAIQTCGVTDLLAIPGDVGWTC